MGKLPFLMLGNLRLVFHEGLSVWPGDRRGKLGQLSSHDSMRVPAQVQGRETYRFR
jgi:hypothetical protein